MKYYYKTIITNIQEIIKNAYKSNKNNNNKLFTSTIFIFKLFFEFK